MTLRARLVALCVLVALLPALPLSIAVDSLVDASFDVALDARTDAALRDAVELARAHVDSLAARFVADAEALTAALDPNAAPARAAEALRRRLSTGRFAVDGVVPADSTRTGRRAGARGLDAAARRHDPHRAPDGAGTPGLPDALVPFAHAPVVRLAPPEGWMPLDVSRRLVVFTDVGRSRYLALWRGRLLLHRSVDPRFVHAARNILHARQRLARMRLSRRRITRTFVLSFAGIYAACLVLTVALASWMAGRIARPVTELARAAHAVAAGDPSVRVRVPAGGETARLVQAFNTMLDRLERQRRRIVEAQRLAAWRDVARHLAHEIKNPLLPIRLTVEELREQYRGDDDAFRAQLEASTRVVGEELDALARLVREFSEFARMPAVSPARADLAALVRDVAALHAGLDVRVEPDGPFEAVFDADALRRVLTNLLENAAGVGAHTVRVHLAREGGEAVVRVADDGPGIAPEHIGRVFEPYFTTRDEGTGLGLALSWNLVTAHGGSIAVDSSPGGGAEFTIRLPDDARTTARHSADSHDPPEGHDA